MATAFCLDETDESNVKCCKLIGDISSYDGFTDVSGRTPKVASKNEMWKKHFYHQALPSAALLHFEAGTMS